jgi:hypothetical protein
MYTTNRVIDATCYRPILGSMRCELSKSSCARSPKTDLPSSSIRSPPASAEAVGNGGPAVEAADPAGNDAINPRLTLIAATARRGLAVCWKRNAFVMMKH